MWIDELIIIKYLKQNIHSIELIILDSISIIYKILYDEVYSLYLVNLNRIIITINNS